MLICYIKLSDKNIIDEGFTIRTDYCERLEEKEEKPSATIPTSTTKKK